MNTDFIIRNETESDFHATEELVRNSFWNVYKPGCSEHFVLHELRKSKNFVPELDFVMEKDSKLIGQIVFVKAKIFCDDGTELSVITFGPLGIAPDFKRKGYGKKLLDYAVEKARELGCGALFIEGNIEFYEKSGFVEAKSKNIFYNDEPRQNDVPYFLCKELITDFLKGKTGTYRTPNEYFVSDEQVEEFDKTFEPKEKLKLPGQLF